MKRIRPATGRARKIAADIQRQIEAGELKSGDALPTSRQLQVCYNATTNDIVAARAILREVGLVKVIFSRECNGTFVV